MLKNCKKGFTLLELLVVVLIIGILAAIALPQYQKVVQKSRLHMGISLVESLYQAQQSYFLTNGAFSKDIDGLEISVPINESCVKTQSKSISRYKCNFGTIGMFNSFSNIQFQDSKPRNAYLHFITDYLGNDGLLRKAGERWCFAQPTDSVAQHVCESIGGEYMNGDESDTWIRYKLR